MISRHLVIKWVDNRVAFWISNWNCYALHISSRFCLFPISIQAHIYRPPAASLAILLLDRYQLIQWLNSGKCGGGECAMLSYWTENAHPRRNGAPSYCPRRGIKSPSVTATYCLQYATHLHSIALILIGDARLILLKGKPFSKLVTQDSKSSL